MNNLWHKIVSGPISANPCVARSYDFHDVALDTAVITHSTASTLNLDFLANDSTFQIDGDSTITNMTLTGVSRNANFIINSGTTTVAQSPGYTETIGVQFTIRQGATLNDQSYNALKFTNSGLNITVYGTMNTYYSGIPSLIDYGGMSNDYIYVGGGTLAYYGSASVTDYFTVPVFVSGGNFIVGKAAGQPAGAKLVVQDKSNYAFPNGKMYSVYMTAAGSTVQLSQSATLECDNDYYQNNGALETMDTTTCTLMDGAQSNGMANIAGGSLAIANPNQQSYGTLNVNCGTLNFAGQYVLAINAKAQGAGSCDLLNVTGTTNLQGASLNVFVNNGPPNGGSSWVIIQDGPGNNIQNGGNLPITTNPQTNLNGSVNNTQYILSF